MPTDRSPVVEQGKGYNLRLCNCSSCIEEATDAGYQEKGMWLDRKQYSEHARARELREEQLEAEGVTLLAQTITQRTIGMAGDRRHPSSTRSTTGEGVDLEPVLQSMTTRKFEESSRKKPVRPEKDVKLKLEQSLRDLDHLQATLSKIIARISPPQRRLIFAHIPSTGKPYVRRDENDLLKVNAGPNMLAPKEKANAYILAIENELVLLFSAAKGVACYEDSLAIIRRDVVVRVILRELDRLDQTKEAEWTWQMTNDAASKTMRHSEHGLVDFVDCSPYYRNEHHRWHPAILAVFLTVLLMHLLCGLSRRASGLLIMGMRCITRILTMGKTDPQLSRISSAIPKDPRTIVIAFDLEPRTRSYICCPKCFALYDDSARLTHCPYKLTPGSPTCGASLVRTRNVNGSAFTYPVRKYVHQEMKEWIARLFSRPGIEDLLDAPLHADYTHTGDEGEDIWDARTFATFPGLDGKSFLRSSSGSESRLVFSLNVDGFNPFGNKAAKQSVTVTGIYMVCLNLPPHLRYLPENMYLVGVVPGPSKPSQSELNHFLALLVDDLLPFWDPGTFLSRTNKFRDGRLVKAVLIPLVSDMVGAKQAAGFPAHSANLFCSYCLLSLEDIENLDRDKWPTRTLEEHLKHAQAWKDASDPAVQKAIYTTYGVRWSELLRLPYWNPLLFTVIDSMHNLYLGLLKYHCRTLWGMDIAADDGDDPSNHPPRSMPDLPHLSRMRKAKMDLYDDKMTAVQALNKATLWHLCNDLNLRRASTRAVLYSHLNNWRRRAAPDDLARLRDQCEDQLAKNPSSVQNTPLGASIAPEPIQVSTSDEANPHPHSGPTPIISPNDEVSTPQRVDKQQQASLQADKTHAETKLRSQAPVHLQGMLFYTQAVLVELCKTIRVNTRGKKIDLALNLLSWRVEENLPVAPPLPVLQSAKGLSEEERERKKIEDIAKVDTWLTSTLPGIQESDLQCWTVPILSALCKKRKLVTTGKKPDLVVRLLRWKNSMDVNGEHANSAATEDIQPTIGQEAEPLGPGLSRSSTPNKASGKQKKAVLGRKLLTEMRSDMAKTELPMWVSHVPSSIGSTSFGKPTADQWRTLCTIHLPITLVRLWGDDKGLSGKMLSNFIDLIVAVEIGTMRIVSEKHAELYDKLMLRYLNSMKELYRDAKVVPNHHVALHLGEFLRSFGSVHAWRAFAFERYNYLLQQENTNKKFGELETTFLKQSCRSANFRPLMQDHVVKETVVELVDAYNAWATEDRRGTRVQDTIDVRKTSSISPSPSSLPPKAAKEDDLDDETYEAFSKAAEAICPGSIYVEGAKKMQGQRFLSRTCLFFPTVFIRGVTYKPYTKSSKDSNIIYRTPDGTETAGRVEGIFFQKSGPLKNETFVIVQALRGLSKDDAVHDSYRRFEFGTGRLYYNRYDRGVVVRPSDVVCHFAKTVLDFPKISTECVHVLPLDVMVTSALLPDFIDADPEQEGISGDKAAEEDKAFNDILE